LLTDHRPCLSGLFEPDIEIVVYENLEDMREKILYYQNHERQRQTIAENAYKRFLNQHTYSHRAMQIILKLEENEKV
jgi:spore maturation protein CgeB